jgi:hypothetical protein
MKFKIEQNRRNVSGFLTLMLLAVFVLFSSCTIRKSLQAHFDIPLTKSFNVAKTYVSNSDSCKAAVELNTVNHQLKEQHAGLDLLLIPLFAWPQSAVILQHHLFPPFAVSCNRVEVPLYILYQNMKVFS